MKTLFSVMMVISFACIAIATMPERETYSLKRLVFVLFMCIVFFASILGFTIYI